MDVRTNIKLDRDMSNKLYPKMPIKVKDCCFEKFSLTVIFSKSFIKFSHKLMKSHKIIRIKIGRAHV